MTPSTLFRTGLDTLDLPGMAGVTVNADTALTYSGIWACVRLLASDISTMPVDAYRKTDGARVPIRPQPVWIDAPDPFDPSVTRIDHFAQVAISLLLDGNAFILVTPSVFDPQRLEVLNPRRVEVKKPGKTPEYRIRDNFGRPTGDPLSPLDILHVKINAKPGQIRGMSPIDANQGSIGISLAAQKYVERFFGQGMMAPGFISIPTGSTTSADELAKDIQKHHGGWRKGGLLGILTGGATFQTSGISPKDAQLDAIFRHQLEEGARIYGIPPFMIGSQEPAGVAYASSVERAQHYIDHCLMHYIAPIEAAYNRLVPGDRRLLNPASDTYVRFNLDALLRGDTKSRFEAHQIALSNKFKTIEEVRALEELPPDRVGTLLETPNNNAPKGSEA